MEVSAWPNGKVGHPGTGYGITIKVRDRDRYFSKDWSRVTVFLGDAEHPVRVNVEKEAFWDGCPHLISVDIQQWLEQHGFIPWTLGSPPKLRLEPVGDAQFLLAAL